MGGRKRKVLPSYNPKYPNMPQYLYYVTSRACLQELKRIPNLEDQGAKHKKQDRDGASCSKRTMCKRAKGNARVTTPA